MLSRKQLSALELQHFSRIHLKRTAKALARVLVELKKANDHDYNARPALRLNHHVLLDLSELKAPTNALGLALLGPYPIGPYKVEVIEANGKRLLNDYQYLDRLFPALIPTPRVESTPVQKGRDFDALTMWAWMFGNQVAVTRGSQVERTKQLINAFDREIKRKPS